MTISAKIIEDSISPDGIRLTTMQLRFPRMVHSEFMTHRCFCLAGDSRLDFDLPSKSKSGSRRVYHMTIKEFVDKWIDGSAYGPASRFNGIFLSLPERRDYSAREVAREYLNFSRNLNLNAACRDGEVEKAYKIGREWYAPADCWEAWRNVPKVKNSDLRGRLSEMNIRQLNEKTGEVVTSKVLNVQRSGLKDVYTVKTKNYQISASADHLIHTKRGWVRLGELVLNQDLLSVYKYGTGEKHDPFKKIDGIWVSRWAKSVRNQIAERQNFKCSETGEALIDSFHIHHVVPRHVDPSLAFDINNVVAVNPEAHRKIHGIQGWQKGVELTSDFELVESITYRGKEETYDLEIAGEFPNFFANGVVVHNSRNASSSRAIPVKKLIEDVRRDPAMPIHWGKNQPGMQAFEEHDDLVVIEKFYTDDHGDWYTYDDRMPKEEAWLLAMNRAIEIAEAFAEAGYHKQIVNRILEPFSHINVVVTSTNWSNFFALRAHEDAQPEIRELAIQMQVALAESQPKYLRPGQWHLPYVTQEEIENFQYVENPDPVALNTLIKVSVSRCARVSYLTHDGKPTTIEQDVALYDRLVGSEPLHASPCEHQGTPDWKSGSTWMNPQLHGNFNGWIQWRKTLEGECQ